MVKINLVTVAFKDIFFVLFLLGEQKTILYLHSRLGK